MLCNYGRAYGMTEIKNGLNRRYPDGNRDKSIDGTMLEGQTSS